MKEYNPNKSYQWNEDDKFIVRGSTINLFNMLIQMEMSKTEYKRFLLFQKSQELMKEVFSDNINNLQEIPQEDKNN